MLQGASEALAEQRVTYVFISTHSQTLHHTVVHNFTEFGYRVKISSDFDSETTSFDGSVIASNPSVKPVFTDFNPLNRLQILKTSPSQQI
jgi:hypothetical protein